MTSSSEPREQGAATVLPSLAPSERRERIAEIVLANESVSARDLASRFDVSVMTVHRDLDELERQGVLRKIRGGATPQPSSLFESNVRYRLATAKAEKETLAHYALAMIEPGQALLLDDATTTLALARLLPSIAPLTVITNYLATIQLLHNAPGIRLIVLGGEYFPSHDSFLGIVCEDAIASLRADVFFMSTSAVCDGIAYHQEQEIVAVKRAMLRAAAKSILLIDHSKLGKTALHQLAPLSAFDLVVVDGGVDEGGLRALEEAKTPFAVAPR
jgi:DeoR/GlpR family transcriptional regulator of sugar metabolism